VSGRETRGAIFGALVWLALAAACAIPHAARANESALRARRIFEAVGVAGELRDVADAAAASIAAGATSLPEADAALMRGIVAAGFDADRLTRRALASFREQCDSRHAAATLAWLERPETRALLARASELEAAPGARAAAASHERDVLLVGFDRRIGRASRSERHAALVLSAMLRAANPMLPSVQRYSEAEIEDLLAAQRRRAVRGAEADPALRARYAGIASAELTEAVRFLRGDSGRWLQVELDRALGQALVRAAEATAAELVEAFGDRVPAAPERVASR
jgi:hypothetical protein